MSITQSGQIVDPSGLDGYYSHPVDGQYMLVTDASEVVLIPGKGQRSLSVPLGAADRVFLLEWRGEVAVPDGSEFDLLHVGNYDFARLEVMGAQPAGSGGGGSASVDYGESVVVSLENAALPDGDSLVFFGSVDGASPEPGPFVLEFFELLYAGPGCDVSCYVQTAGGVAQQMMYPQDEAGLAVPSRNSAVDPFALPFKSYQSATLNSIYLQKEAELWFPHGGSLAVTNNSGSARDWSGVAIYRKFDG